MDRFPPGSGAFARTLDARLAPDATAEAATVTMETSEDHLNGNGIVHGGVIMSLLDMAMASAVGCTLSPQDRAASIQIQTSFLKAAQAGGLVAEGRVVRRGRALAFAEGEVRDASGTPLARANGIWAISPRS